MRRFALGVTVAALTLVAGPVAAIHPTFETWRPGRTELISVRSDGTQADRNLDHPQAPACYCPPMRPPAISADGRFVAFASKAANLVPGDTNNYHDIFVKDRMTGEIERVSVASDASQANFISSSPAISSDGRYVAFTSSASNLVPNDTNGGNPMFSTFTDVFVHDRQTARTERISVNSDEEQTFGSSGAPYAWAEEPAISADGRFVAFRSNATNLVPGAGGSDAAGRIHIYVRDRLEATTSLASAASNGAPGNGNRISAPSMSADGSRIAFSSISSNLAAGDNDDLDVFVKDMASGSVQLVSVSTDGVQQNAMHAYTGVPSISGNGRYVAWSSQATNLVPNDSNGKNFIAYGWGGGEDVFVRDLLMQKTERVSLDPDGGESVADFLEPSLSYDGRYAVSYGGTGVYPDDPERNAAGYWLRRVYVHDRVLGTTEVVSVDDSGNRANDHAMYASISADGRYVAFSSHGTNLVAGDTNGVDDFFVRDRGPEVGAGSLQAVREGDRIAVTGWASFAGSALVSAADPSGDGASVGGVPASELGAEMSGAEILYRPERNDLLLRWRLSALPHVPTQGGFGAFTPGVAGRPGVVYGMRLETTAGAYEVRMMRAAATANPANAGDDPPQRYVGLFSCATACVEVGRLGGGLGTPGPEVRASLPLSTISGAAEDSPISSVRAFTAIGEAAAAELHTVDDVALGTATIPRRSVMLGIAPPETPEGEVTFHVDAARTGSRFEGSLPDGGGPVEVWAKVCLGWACSTSRTRV